MGYEQVFRGLLEFPDASAFERALDEIRNDLKHSNADEWKAHMISPTVLVLDHPLYGSATYWQQTMLGLHALAEHACHGYAIGAIKADGEVQFETAFSRAAPHNLPNDPPQSPLPAADDYFAIIPGKTFVFVSLGAETPYVPHWQPRYETDPPGAYFSIPDARDPGDTLNERWGGDLFMKDGARLYDVFSVSVDGIPARRKEFTNRYAWVIGDNNAKPGDAWVANTANDLLYLYVVEAFEDVETPFGKIEHTMRVRREYWGINTYEDFYHYHPWDATESFRKSVDIMWFARGLGLVKIHETGTGVLYSLAEARS